MSLMSFLTQAMLVAVVLFVAFLGLLVVMMHRRVIAVTIDLVLVPRRVRGLPRNHQRLPTGIDRCLRQAAPAGKGLPLSPEPVAPAVAVVEHVVLAHVMLVLGREALRKMVALCHPQQTRP